MTMAGARRKLSSTLTPAGLRRLDSFLLRKFPVIWATRAHMMIPYSLAFMAMLASVTLAVEILGEGGESLGLTIGVGGALLLVVWTVLTSVQAVSYVQERAPVRPGHEVVRFAALLLWSSIVSAMPVVMLIVAAKPEATGWHGLMSAASALWLASAMYVSNALIIEMIFIGYLGAVIVGFISAPVWGLIIAWNFFAGSSSPPTWALYLTSAVSIAILCVMAYRVLRRRVNRRYFGILTALAVPVVLLGTIAARRADQDGTVDGVLALATAGSLLALLAMLPLLRTVYRDVLLTPESPAATVGRTFGAIIRTNAMMRG